MGFHIFSFTSISVVLICSLSHQSPGLCFPSCCLFSEYYYVNLKKTWVKAQKFCRKMYSDLASFESMDNITSLNRPNLVSSLTWIGMSDDLDTWKEVMGNESTSWRWSSTDETSKTGYSKWFLGQPDSFLGEFCGAIDHNGLWGDWDCDTVSHFICYDGKK
uniref:C-type lectin domain-containing protein n=1 Tax=Sphaeramia orbicularis TaxID=375764 RepID=A0A672YE70_9TELE